MSGYIKVDELKEKAKYWIADDDGHVLGDFLKCAEIPSIDIEPKRGRWVETNYTDCGAPVYMCSVCTHLISDMEVRKYCPNCGADMREREGE